MLPELKDTAADVVKAMLDVVGKNDSGTKSALLNIFEREILCRTGSAGEAGREDSKSSSDYSSNSGDGDDDDDGDGDGDGHVEGRHAEGGGGDVGAGSEDGEEDEVGCRQTFAAGEPSQTWRNLHDDRNAVCSFLD